MNAVNIMPYYQNRFNAGETGATTGLIFALYTVGQMTGPFFGGTVIDKFGRRAGMFCGACIICVGMAIASSANVKAQLEFGRYMLGFGAAFMSISGPSYLVELCPPHWRGRMTGAYNVGWYGGSIPAAAISLGTQKIQSDLSWRLPLIIQGVPAFFVLCNVLFLPESPRWLYSNGREEEARAFLVKYHGNKDPNNAVVQLEWSEIQANISQEGADKRWWDFRVLFNTHSARWRSLMVIMMAVCGQFSGSGLGYFNTQIYKAVGYSSYQQFILNLGVQIVSFCSALTGMANCDRFPRRRVLPIGSICCSVCLALNGSLTTVWLETAVGAKKNSIGQASVAFYFLFQVCYAFTYTPLQPLFPAECLHSNSRAKGMIMDGIIVGCFTFINTFCGPIAIANIGAQNWVFVFMTWDFIESILWTLLLVETQGRTLEELEEVFSAPNPVAASKAIRKVTLKKTA
ncbi:general substrate transporter [Calocera viscosa TUFC12733]|uniref:General substrate transporter n=1 Tax=Calocera viscosa (strain TUFC12733) TaxID=1330018 RepID=A0A167GEP7_CALVF|nr:general substrate transporter [Calocera viscosa TUFC12733]